MCIADGSYQLAATSLGLTEKHRWMGITRTLFHRTIRDSPEVSQNQTSSKASSVASLSSLFDSDTSATSASPGFASSV